MLQNIQADEAQYEGNKSDEPHNASCKILHKTVHAESFKISKLMVNSLKYQLEITNLR